MFEHDLRNRIELEMVTEEHGRYYILPTGESFDSVTTVLSKYYKKDFSGWKSKVGNKRATEILTQAGIRGTAIHDLCEKYVLNDPDYAKGAMAVNKSQFLSLKPTLDTRVTKIYGVEFPLHSIKMRTAGTVDLLCDWNGVPSVVDYKTSKKIKKEEWIENYFVQASVYALMATQHLKIPFRQIIILMMVDNEPPIEYKKSALDYVKQVNTIFVESRGG